MWEWDDFSNKKLLIETEQFQHGGKFRRRPVTVVSLLRITGKARDASNAKPLACDIGHEQEARMFNTEAGHIMGLRLGGVNISENVVPMYAHVNRNLFRDVERAIEEVYTAGQNMGVVYRLIYSADGDPRVPARIDVRVLRNLAFPDALGTFTFDLPAVYTKSVPQNTPVTTRVAIDGQIQTLFQLARAAVAEGWCLENSSVKSDFAGWAERGRLPPVGKRPYAFLDYIYFELSGNTELDMAGVGTIGGGWNFSEAQRSYIVLANRYSQTGGKLGEIWSDAADDPIKTALLDLGADSGVEIDHIMPKSRGGSNAFSNAQVTSRAFNGSKSNTL